MLRKLRASIIALIQGIHVLSYIQRYCLYLRQIQSIIVLVDRGEDIWDEDTINKCDRLIWHFEASWKFHCKLRPCPTAPKTAIDIETPYGCHLLSTEI